jgi:hypothetical protein
VGSFSNGGEVYGVTGDDAFLYVGDLQDGVEVLDIRNPESPQMIAGAARYGVHGVTHRGKYVYVTTGNRGFIIFEHRERSGR